ncbi:MAG: hypothetical protein BWY47_00940 [Bacteroidetes bacterium ADurb.Bin302]|jgi:hypothetical protein|nr:MAG: hypothetical protein BWY47_00940 [Bacteroidetes bacterium ADurb.Bin302]
MKYSAKQIYSEKVLESFKKQCVKAKFLGMYDKWLNVKYIEDWKKNQSIKTSFADWLIFIENIDLDDKKLDKIVERLDKL